MSPLTLPPPRVTDPAAFGRVAVLLGGSSSEREVSLQSGANVLQALQAGGIDAHAVDGVDALLQDMREGRGYDRVFNILHGGVGENGVLQGLLRAMHVPCTGSGVLGAALSLDKIRTKQVWQSLGLPTPRYVRLSAGSPDRAQRVRDAARQLGLPVIVKPANEGSSVGITRVFSDAELDAAVELAARYDGELLMEQLILGEELTVAILGEHALPSIRIVPKGDWYDYHAKYVAEDTRYLCPGLEGADEEAIGRLALAAFMAVGCQGWGRVDVMRDRASGEFRLLEVNTAPGMTSHSLVPKAARQAGMSMEQLCWRILEATLGEGAA